MQKYHKNYFELFHPTKSSPTKKKKVHKQQHNTKVTFFTECCVFRGDGNKRAKRK
jgi:hypothetical protein